MKLIVGLGNPGKKYKDTRHNAGFVALDEIRKAWELPEFESNKKFDAEISEGKRKEEKIILAKPQSFMNLSGQVVKSLMAFYKIAAGDILVIHDDLDIDLGSFKLSADSSSAGHNGVQSIFDELGTQAIRRVRVGIEGAEKKKDRIVPGDVFVLQDFSKEEIAIIKKLSEEIAKILD
jgi:peptidyl-tRNA hydrolase, PTH1 family